MSVSTTLTISITSFLRLCLCLLLRFWKMSQLSSWSSLKPTARWWFSNTDSSLYIRASSESERSTIQHKGLVIIWFRGWIHFILRTLKHNAVKMYIKMYMLDISIKNNFKTLLGKKWKARYYQNSWPRKVASKVDPSFLSYSLSKIRDFHRVGKRQDLSLLYWLFYSFPPFVETY